jgi:hypothetical protein
MGEAKLDRVALEVDDIEGVAHDLDALLGIRLRISEARALGLKAAVGNDGIELVQRTVDQPKLAAYWRPPLAALCVRVDDLTAARKHLAAAGIHPVQRVTLATGLEELFYGQRFRGLPLVLFAHTRDDFTDSVSQVGGPGPTVEWYDDTGAVIDG